MQAFLKPAPALLRVAAFLRRLFQARWLNRG